ETLSHTDTLQIDICYRLWRVGGASPDRELALVAGVTQPSFRERSVSRRDHQGNILNESHRKSGLQSWLQTLKCTYDDRLLPLDLTPAISGEKSRPRPRKRAGSFPPATDLLPPPPAGTAFTS